jgi:tetratricopeptide (TPR) repeat protein
MTTLVTLALDATNTFAAACAEIGYQDRRVLDASDYARFRTWQQSYLGAARHGSKPDLLRTIGREIYAWLDGTRGLLARLPETAPPHRFEFRVPHTLTPDQEAFLHAPWELLADDLGPWAGRTDLLYCPLRRIGNPAQPAEPSPYALSLLFMAAAPAGADNLAFEQEEAAILGATVDLDLDLAVEESGTLPLLRVRAAEHHPDVIHLSCHGTTTPVPALLLEDEFGDPAPATAPRLITDLGGHPLRLLFLSACETAQTGQASASATALPPLTVSLVQAGTHAVLGWAAPVLDPEATRFAAALYRWLAEGLELDVAVGRSRRELLLPAQSDLTPGRDWHLARLFLGPPGGGVLASGKEGRRLSQGRANKAFLNRARAQVEVASPAEFVGRRQVLQRILREMHRPTTAGVLVHGLGQQGKSSLAARIADRLEDRQYAIAVVHGGYAIADIVAAIRESSPGQLAETWCHERGPRIETPSLLERALVELLEGACGRYQITDGSVLRRPLLLIIDDLEQALEQGGEKERHRFRPDYAEVMGAVIRAFGRANTQSRLLFTSRFQFTLRMDGRELSDRLLDIHLTPMSEAEASRQLATRARTVKEEDRVTDAAPALARSDRIVRAAVGNPGLQNLLTGLALEDPARCDRCLAQMEQRRAQRPEPDEQGEPVEQRLLDFLEQIAVREIAAALSPNQRELLRASTLFATPIPEAVLVSMAKEASISSDPADASRLLALGAWDLFEGRQKERDVAASSLVAVEVSALSEAEASMLATLAVRPLFAAWGGEEASRTRSIERDWELTRLSVLAGEADILRVCASYAVNLLANAGANREAGALGVAALAVMDSASVSPPLDLLWAVAEVQVVIGDVSAARANLERGLASIREAGARSEPVEPGIHLGILLAHARILVGHGQIEEALPELETAAGLAPGERDREVVRGDIADILSARGDLDEALRIRREEQLPVYERLGDVRERAVTMGNIADILYSRGDLDEALRIRREEELPVYERLGDVRELLVGRTNLAILLAQRQREEDAEEIARLLVQAHQDAVRMGLPEAQQIEQILHALFGI